MSASEITDVIEIVKIPVIRITNPFNPREFVNEHLYWKPESTLLDYFPLPMVEVVISVNGKIIEAEEFGKTHLDRTDNLVVCPIPTGGDSGKSVLRIVAMIAITYFSAGMASGIYGAMGGTFVAAGAATSIAMIQAGVMIAGSLLVNSLLAPPQATKGADVSSSSSYGIDGAKNTSVEGIPVPVCYGEFRMAGNILGLHVENDAEDSQTLYMLMSAGEGPVASLGAVMINDNPMSDYTNVEVQTRLGLPNQLPIPWFEDTVVAINKGQKMTVDWFYSTTTTRVDKLRLDFVAPNGLFSVNKDTGELESFTVDLKIDYRVAGSSSSWSQFPTESTVGSWTKAVRQDILDAEGVPTGAYSWHLRTGTAISFDNLVLGTKITDAAALAYLLTAPTTTETLRAGGGSSGSGFEVTLTISEYPSYVQTTQLTAAKRSAVRKSFSTPKLDPQKYEIRVSRAVAHSTLVSVSDEVYLADVNEIVLEKLSYPNTALVGLKIKMTDQLSGLPKVTYMNGGRKVAVYGKEFSTSTDNTIFEAASKNPAWIVYDILVNPRFGGSMSTSRLDWIAFKAWADHCEEKKLEWNGVLDTEMNVWDACQLVLRVGHAQLINVGTRYTVVIEKEDIPKMMFSVANIVEGSYKETWLGTADRANEINVTFFDRTDDYKQRTLKLYDPSAITLGEKQRASSITLYGVTDYDTAMSEAKLQMNMNRYILKTVNFSAPMEAVACSVGDLVYLQHDMTEWAVAGRFEAGCTSSTMILDRSVDMTYGKQYKLLMTHDAVQRSSGIVSSVIGMSVFINGTLPGTVKRININGTDYRIAGTFDQGATTGVILDDEHSFGATAGMPYSLWDTDVIEEYDVVNLGSNSSTITLQGGASFVPHQFGNWMFGESEKVKKLFRIKAIVGGHDYKRDITAIEYSPKVYDYSRFGSVVVVPPEDGVIGPVRSLQIYEETYISGENIISRVVAAWQTPLVGLYSGADIYVKKNAGALEKVIEAKNRTSITIDAVRGDVITVKVVAFNLFNKRASFDLSPSMTYTVIGETGIVTPPVTGAQFIWSGRDCKITWRYNSTTHSYQFGSEPNGGDAGAPDPQFKDFEVRVYDEDGKTLRRTEHVTDNFYTYTYDKNFADRIDRHLVFEIRTRDILNNLGVAAKLTATNPAPTVKSVAVLTSFESATISYTHSADPDFVGAIVWVSRIAADLSDFAKADSYIVYNGPDSSILVPGLMFNATYYYRIAAYDAFGYTELLPTPTYSFKTSYLNVEVIADDILKDSKLLPALRTRINLIDAEEGIEGSVNTRIKVVKDVFYDPKTGVPATLAKITALEDVSATSTSAHARLTHGLKAQVLDPGGALPLASASIVAMNDVSATSTSALARFVNQLNTTVGGYSTSIEQNTTTVNGIKAQHTIKIDNNGHVSGYGLHSELIAGTVHSEFIVLADVFAVVSPGEDRAGSKPFVIGTVNGVTRTVIQKALIGDASINTAMIGDLQVNTLKIAGNAVTLPFFKSGAKVGGNATLETAAHYMEAGSLVIGVATAYLECPGRSIGSIVAIYLLSNMHGWQKMGDTGSAFANYGSITVQGSYIVETSGPYWVAAQVTGGPADTSKLSISAFGGQR